MLFVQHQHHLLPLMQHQLEIFLELGSSSAIISAMQNTQAIGCISKIALQNVEGIEILQLPNFQLSRDFLLLQNKRAHIPLITEKWMDLVLCQS